MKQQTKMKMKTKEEYSASGLGYAHCVKFTPGCPDRAPFSQYEMRVVPVTYWTASESLGGGFACKDASGIIIGDGMTMEECQHDAAYQLMARSRTVLSVTWTAAERDESEQYCRDVEEYLGETGN